MRRSIIVAAVVAAAVSVLGGGGYAMASGLITGKDVKNNSLTGADIHRIRGGDINGRTIQCRNLATNVQDSITACNGGKTVVGGSGSVVVNAPKGDKGAPGQPGPTGPQGVAGPQGAVGVSGYQVHNTEVRLAAGATGTATRACPSGVALGGGFDQDAGQPATVLSSAPVYDPSGVATGWSVRATAGATAVNVKAWVICATVTQ
jgi:hypothetical protein